MALLHSSTVGLTLRGRQNVPFYRCPGVPQRLSARPRIAGARSLVLGRGLADEIGAASRSVAGTLLIATGGYALWQALRGAGDQDGESEGDGHGDEQVPGPGRSWGRRVLTGPALSLDNLAVGFSLGPGDVDLATAAAVIGTVSLGLSLVGLELGARIGGRTGRRGELLGSVALIAVGIAVAAGAI